MRLVYGVIASACWVVYGCSDPLGPIHGNVNAAHSAWEELAPAAYSFEVAVASSWFPRSDYVRVQVESGVVVSARDTADNEVPGYSLTLESIWDSILDAQSRDDINAARFTREGIPLEVNLGDWALDGGVHYWVREFRMLP